MPRGRPKYSFFLLDTPSDHEIDGRLSTECQIISSILHNRGFKAVVKTETISSKSRFLDRRWGPYNGVGFVHVAGHG